MSDQTLTCIEKDCRAEFTLTEKESNWFIAKKMTPPKRCAECRAKRKKAKEVGERHE